MGQCGLVLNVGDLLEITLERGKIMLAPKTLVDRRIEESLEDYQKGRVYGPFASAEDLVQSLRQPGQKAAKRMKQTKKRSK